MQYNMNMAGAILRSRTGCTRALLLHRKAAATARLCSSVTSHQRTSLQQALPSAEVASSPGPSDAERVTAVRVETTRRITALGLSGRPREATLQLAEMARLGVQPDNMAATALVNACVRCRKMDMALSVFDELFGELLQPDDVAFSVLVRGYGGSTPPQWAAISGVLGRMQNQFGLKPGTSVYSSLLDICVRTKDDDRAYEIIERMARTGIEADKLVVNAVKSRKALRSHLRRVYQSTNKQPYQGEPLDL